MICRKGALRRWTTHTTIIKSKIAHDAPPRDKNLLTSYPTQAYRYSVCRHAVVYSSSTASWRNSGCCLVESDLDTMILLVEKMDRDFYRRMPNRKYRWDYPVHIRQDCHKALYQQFWEEKIKCYSYIYYMWRISISMTSWHLHEISSVALATNLQTTPCLWNY